MCVCVKVHACTVHMLHACSGGMCKACLHAQRCKHTLHTHMPSCVCTTVHGCTAEHASTAVHACSPIPRTVRVPCAPFTSTPLSAPPELPVACTHLHLCTAHAPPLPATPPYVQLCACAPHTYHPRCTPKRLHSPKSPPPASCPPSPCSACAAHSAPPLHGC